MFGTTSLLALLGAVATVLVAYAFAREGQRRRALERIGSGIGLLGGRSADGLRSELGALPSMTPNRRHVFAHVLRSADEIVCDWRVLGKPKERPRRSTQTLVAVRRSGARLPSFRLFAATNRRALADRRVGSVVVLEQATGRGPSLAVAGPDAAALQSFFDAARLAPVDLPDDLVVEGGGDWIAAHVPGRRVAPADLAPLIERVRVLADQIATD